MAMQNRLIGLTALTILALSTGCAPSLAKAGFAPVGASVAATPERCASLSDRASNWSATALGLTTLTGAGGLALIPVTGRDAQNGLAVGIATASALAAVAGHLASKASSAYVGEGCGSPIAVKR